MGKSLWKRLASLATAGCLAVAMLCTTAGAEETESKTYLALGDSISTGYRLTNPEQESFPALVADACNFTLDSEAQDGETSATLLEKLTSGTLAGNVANADVITLTIGGNDLMNTLYSYLAVQTGGLMTAEEIQAALQSGNTQVIATAAQVISGFAESAEAQAALAQFAGNLTGIVAAIETINPDAQIIITTQYNPYAYFAKQYGSMVSQAATISNAFEVGINALNMVIRTVAGDKCLVADAYTAFANAEQNPCNASVAMGMPPVIDLDFHPNAVGHNLIAETVKEVIIGAQADADKALLESTVATLQAFLPKEPLEVSQSVVNTQEAAMVLAQQQVVAMLQPMLPTGMTATVAVTDFQAAVAGTAEVPAGTNGSFSVDITLEFNGMTAEVGAVPAVITAAAYTPPTEDPSEDEGNSSSEKEEDSSSTVEEDSSSESGEESSKVEEDSSSEADKGEASAPEKENATTSPETGNSVNVIPYVVCVLAAGAFVVLLRRKAIVK